MGKDVQNCPQHTLLRLTDTKMITVSRARRSLKPATHQRKGISLVGGFTVVTELEIVDWLKAVTFDNNNPTVCLYAFVSLKS